jgi:hypothetical protein
MGYWCTLHLFDDKKFYKEIVPILKGEFGDLTNHCLEFLKSHRVGGLSNLSVQEINDIISQTIDEVNSISNSLNDTFKANTEYQKIKDYDSHIKFLNNLNGYEDFCKFLEYFIFKTCSDFYPHLPLGKGGVSRNFKLDIKTLCCSVLENLDNWNEFLCGHMTGITNWITHEDVELLYLDKDNLLYNDNERAEGFLTLLDVARSNKLGLIIGVDMAEDRLELLQGEKLTKPEIWRNKNNKGLLWKR